MTMRISGIASGLDVDSMVKEMMAARKVPADKLKQQKQTVEWQRDVYKDFNKKLLDFRNNKLFNFKAEKTLGAKQTTIIGDNQVFNATARADAPIGTTTLKVMELATSASMSGSDIRKPPTVPAVPNEPVFDPAKKLEDQASNLDLNSQMLVGTGTDYSFKINNTEIKVDTSVDSLNDIISRINKTTNVNAFYDTFSGKVTFTSKATGQSADIEITDDTNNFTGNVLKLNGTVNPGGNAKVEINGIPTERESNSFSVNNIEIVLKQKSVFTGVAGQESDASKYVATSISTTTDTNKIMDSIKTFITDYNDMLKSLQDKVNEQKFRDFQPLTDDQRSAMKEDEIKKWEEKAKSGLLRNDTIFTKAIGYMRSAGSAIVETGSEEYKTLSSIGIGSKSYSDLGKLSIKDEEKLRTAIETDPDAVMALFSAAGNGDSNESDVGIAQKMYDNLKVVFTDLTTKAGTSMFNDTLLKEDSTIGKQLRDLSKQIVTWDRRLVDIETNYYNQFSSMEAAMNRLNAQSQNLVSAFSGG